MSAKSSASMLAGVCVAVAALIVNPAHSQNDVDARMSEADAAAGQGVSFRCIVCHSLGEGEASRIGPNLFGVVGRNIGSVDDFAYSDALVVLGAAGETWSLEFLDAFLQDPSGVVPGLAATKDPLVSETDRYNLLAYLMTLGD